MKAKELALINEVKNNMRETMLKVWNEPRGQEIWNNPEQNKTAVELYQAMLDAWKELCRLTDAHYYKTSL